MVTDTIELIRNSRPIIEELADDVAPDNGVAGLEVEFIQDVIVARCVDFAFDAGPKAWVRVCGLGAGVVRVVEVLDYGLAGGFEDVLVGVSVIL